MLETNIPIDADAREFRHLLASQTGSPAAFRVSITHDSGVEFPASRAKKIAKFIMLSVQNRLRVLRMGLQRIKKGFGSPRTAACLVGADITYEGHTVKAATLEAFGSPLVVGTVPDPVLGTGEVIVDVVAAGVLPYTSEVISNKRRYMLALPIVLGAGAVGRVRAIGPDATRLAVDDWVLCDPTVRSRDDAIIPDITLQGLSARGPGGMHLQAYYHDGAYAQQMRLPTENAIALGNIETSDAGRWCALQTLLVPYGGLLAADFQPGETLLVSGATGNFGSSCVAVALAMGAGCVIAPGRNERMLYDLGRRFGPRVRTVVLTGDEDEDRKRMAAAAAGPIDVVLDLLPPSAGVQPVRAAAMTVREYGRVVLMGGVGMLGGDDLALPYPWIMRNNITIRGQWMFPRHACARLIALVKAGLLSLEHFEITEFDLDHANDAVAYAAADGGPFHVTVIKP